MGKSDKFEARRESLAESTLAIMGKKGYAHTSMRDIAAEAGVSLGTLHYYFVDKSELLTFCIKTFKRAFIQKVMGNCEAAHSLKDLITAFCEVCSESMVTDYREHRVWFDIRSQALYEPIFIPLRVEIEKELEEMFRTFIVAGEQLSGHAATMKTDAVGWMFEGLFEIELFNFIKSGNAAQAKERMEYGSRELCDQLFHLT